jgi:hypothetical protein
VRRALLALDALLDRPVRRGKPLGEDLGLERDGRGRSAADGHGLVPDHDLQPCDVRRRVERVEPADVDLHRPLEGVLGCVRRPAPAPCDPQQDGMVVAQHRLDPRMPGDARRAPDRRSRRRHVQPSSSISAQQV